MTSSPVPKNEFEPCFQQKLYNLYNCSKLNGSEFETEATFGDNLDKVNHLFKSMKEYNGDCPYGFYQVCLIFKTGF